jgi:hypothetical protein
MGLTHAFLQSGKSKFENNFVYLTTTTPAYWQTV